VDAGARVALIGAVRGFPRGGSRVHSRVGGIVATAVADVTDIERTARRPSPRLHEQLGPIDVLVKTQASRARWARSGDRSGGVVGAPSRSTSAGAYMLTSAVLRGWFRLAAAAYQHHSQACVHRWARLLLRRCEGRGGEADRDARGGVETAPVSACSASDPGTVVRSG
jgi:hypothetical protein